MTDEATALESKDGGPLAALLDLYLSPAEAMLAIVRRARILFPLLVLVALNVTFTGIWLHNVEPKEFMRAQLEQAGRWEQIPAERRADVLDSQAKVFPIIGWVGAVLGAPLLVLLVGAVYLFIFRFFYAAELSLRQSLSITAHAFLAVALVTTSLTLLVLWLKGDWNVNPQEALQANLSLLLDRESAGKAVYALAQSLDLFSLWILGLLAAGYGVASRRPASGAAFGVAAPWVVYVLVKVGWAALM